jgi:DNA modification methylase
MENVFQIIQNDALHGLTDLPTASADCVVTDPPYCSGGIGEAQRVAAKGQGLRSENLSRFGWFVGDNMTTTGLACLLRAVAVESVRVVKPSGSLLIFCDWRMLHTLVPAIESAGVRYQGLVVWDKGHFGMGNGFRCQHELIMHFTCGKPEYYDKATGNVLRDSRVSASEREHQTQKPTDLLRSLIRVASPRGGVVIDPFCGSGSTGVAAIEEGRAFVGIERDEAYSLIAERRLTEAVACPKLFEPVITIEQENLFQ